MKDFSKIQRWDIYAVGDYSHTEYEEYCEGSWVRYEDYKELIEEYLELKSRINGSYE